MSYKTPVNRDGIPCAVLAARSHRTLREAEFSYGHTRQCDEYTWRWYRFFWTWSALRFSSISQDRAWKRLGSELFYKRIERVKAFRKRLLEGNYRVSA